MHKRAAAVPIANEVTTLARKPPIIPKIMLAVLLSSSLKASITELAIAEESYLKISPTTLNKIIATASFINPSPKTIENSLGYS